VAEILERVGLAGRERVALRKFSKGMVQRLGLAQALLHRPDLVILDEPMSGLDPVGRREVRDLILAQKEAGRSVFFSSHILQDAEMICDRIAILAAGKLKYSGSLDRVASRRTLWYEVAVSSGGEQSLERVEDIETLTRLLNDVQESGGEVVSVWPRRETLEDLFLREVGAGPGGEGRP
jgi:ABC-2 type transport system ATP-binding protein